MESWNYQRIMLMRYIVRWNTFNKLCIFTDVFWDNWNKLISMPKKPNCTMPLGPQDKSLASSLRCTRWTHKTPHCVNNLNTIDWGHVRRSSIPMHSHSVISMVEKFVPSPNLIVISKWVILDICSLCNFVGNVLSDLGIFKKALPNHLLCLFDIPSIIIKHNIIPLHLESHKVRATKPVKVCSLMMEPLFQIYHDANSRVTMVLFVTV